MVEDKFITVVGRWILRIAGIILSINLICRAVDAEKSTKYIQVMGKVTKTQTTYHWVRAGGRSRETPTYHVWMEYAIPGTSLKQHVTESYSSDLFSMGDEVPVMCQEDPPHKAYAAKQDWLTRAYLPVSKSYNAPFILSMVLFGVGYIFYTDSPVLDWFLDHAYSEMTIGKGKNTGK